MTKPPNSGGLVFLAVVLGLNLLLLLLLRGGAELRQRLGTDPRASARPPPCSIGYLAHRGLQTSAPSLGTGVRDADTRLPCSPRSRCPTPQPTVPPRDFGTPLSRRPNPMP